VPQAASAIDQLPAWINRTTAFVILAVLVAYVIWVWRAPRQIGRSNWQVTLPNGPLTLLQIAIGIVDLACCAFAMYMLMPDEPHIGFVTLSVVFVSATLLGFASHAPGGIGVFDAAMLIALWQFDREDVLAGLLLFRLVYYIIPFALALLILGLRELMLTVRPAAKAGKEHAPAANSGPDEAVEATTRSAEAGDAGPPEPVAGEAERR
jgi:glycosyltransferase 2 family protein